MTDVPLTAPLAQSIESESEAAAEALGRRKFALVTGASSGIGLELARQFAENGFDLLITARGEGLASARDSLADTGAEVTTVAADLSEKDGPAIVMGAVAASGRDLDAVALNAGFGNGGAFVDIPLDDELDLIQTNIVAVVHFAKLIVPRMIERGGGRILFTASVASLMPGPYYATYAASKAFVLSFSEALRHEVKDHGITVTALMPGPTDTHFFASADMEDTPVGKSGKDDPAKVAADGFAALMEGKDHVVAGSVKNKLQATGAAVLSEPMKAAMHAKSTVPEALSD